MKVIVDEPQTGFAGFCERALAGETVQFELPGGALLQLTPIPSPAQIKPVPPDQLASCYDDEEWAVFENNCGKESE